MLPLFEIAKLVGQLALVTPMVTDGVEKMRKLVEALRQGDGNIAKEVEDLRQAISLQNTVNDKVEDQLRIMQALLANMQKSLRMLSFAALVTGMAALAALFHSLFR